MFAVQEDRFLEWFAQGALAYRNLGRVVCAYHPLPYDDVLCDSRALRLILPLGITD
jgi:hypothetical protein